MFWRERLAGTLSEAVLRGLGRGGPLDPLTGVLTEVRRGDVGFWAKNGGSGVKLSAALQKNMVSWVSYAGCSVRGLVSDGQKGGRNCVKLNHFGVKVRRFLGKMKRFGAFLKGDFRERARPILSRSPMLTGSFSKGRGRRFLFFWLPYSVQ